MKRDHTEKWQRFDSLCQTLGHVPTIRHAELVKLPGETDEERGATQSPRSMIFTLSASGPKRDGHEIMQEGWHTDAYRQNPVVLWAHTRDTLPIGKSLREWLAPGRGGKTLRGEPEFLTAGDNPMAEQVFRLYNSGVLNAVSVGWNTLKWEAMRDADGWITGIRFVEQELLEYSAVPVPADPDALKHSIQDGTLSRDFLDRFSMTPLIDTSREENKGVFFIGLPQPPADDVKLWIDLAATPRTDNTANPPAAVILPKAKVIDEDDDLSREAIRHEDHGDVPMAEAETTWDGAAAKGRIRGWATDAGQSEEIDFRKYRKGFVFRDKSKANDVNGYRGAHHDIIDGKLVSVPRGVRAVAQRIQQQAMGVPLSAYEGMRAHMESEYARMGETPPWNRVQGRLYESVLRLLDTTTIEHEITYLRGWASELAYAVYGEERQPEMWEGPVGGDNVMSGPARAWDAKLSMYIGDTETRHELIRSMVRDIDPDLFATLDEFDQALLRLSTITGKTSTEEIISDVEQRYAPPTPAVEEPVLDDEAFARLEALLDTGDKKVDEPVDKTSDSDNDPIRQRMDALLARLSQTPPVAGNKDDAA